MVPKWSPKEPKRCPMVLLDFQHNPVTKKCPNGVPKWCPNGVRWSQMVPKWSPKELKSVRVGMKARFTAPNSRTRWDRRQSGLLRHQKLLGQESRA